MSSARKWAAIVATALVGVVATGCAAVFGPGGDESYRESIPAALISSDLGIADAGADTGLDGFTRSLFVRVNLDDFDLAPQELRGILRIILDHNSIRADEIEIAVKNAEGDRLDFDVSGPQLELSKYSVASSGNLVLSFDAARDYIKDTGSAG